MLTARRQTKSNKGKNALTINEGIMAARPERVAISPLGVTCKGGLGKNSIQDRLRAEILAARSARSTAYLTADDMHAMPFLNAVVQVSRLIRRGQAVSSD